MTKEKRLARCPKHGIMRTRYRMKGSFQDVCIECQKDKRRGPTKWIGNTTKAVMRFLYER